MRLVKMATLAPITAAFAAFLAQVMQSHIDKNNYDYCYRIAIDKNKSVFGPLTTTLGRALSFRLVRAWLFFYNQFHLILMPQAQGRSY